jgi:hypothetical protein
MLARPKRAESYWLKIAKVPFGRCLRGRQLLSMGSVGPNLIRHRA